MDEQLFTPGARVVSLDGQDVGIFEALTGEGSDARLVVRLHGDDRTMMVPYSLIDRAQSTEDLLVIQGAVGDLLQRGMDIDQHESRSFGLAAEEAIARVHEVNRGKVVVDKRVELVPHEAHVDVGTDRVDVERVPIGEEVDTPPQVRQEGDTLVVPVVEEVLVVTKRYRIIEEVRVTKYRDVQTETFHEELRREVLTVTEEDVDGNIIDR
jgi:stress response protein YsnF